MENRQAVVENGKVVNIIVGNHPAGVDIPPDSKVAAGWLYDGAAFSDPNPPPRAAPMQLTPRQMRLVLNALGMRQVVEDAVAASDQDTKDMWEFSSFFLRTDPVLLAMAAQLGVSDELLDEIFEQGASL